MNIEIFFYLLGWSCLIGAWLLSEISTVPKKKKEHAFYIGLIMGVGIFAILKEFWNDLPMDIQLILSLPMGRSGVFPFGMLLGINIGIFCALLICVLINFSKSSQAKK